MRSVGGQTSCRVRGGVRWTPSVGPRNGENNGSSGIFLRVLVVFVLFCGHPTPRGTAADDAPSSRTCTLLARGHPLPLKGES
jgi:hypothetical protein